MIKTSCVCEPIHLQAYRKAQQCCRCSLSRLSPRIGLLLAQIHACVCRTCDSARLTSRAVLAEMTPRTWTSPVAPVSAKRICAAAASAALRSARSSATVGAAAVHSAHVSLPPCLQEGSGAGSDVVHRSVLCACTDIGTAKQAHMQLHNVVGVSAFADC